MKVQQPLNRKTEAIMAKYSYPETPAEHSLDARIRVVLDAVADDGELWEAGRDAFFDALIEGNGLGYAVEQAVETAIAPYADNEDELKARRKAASAAWNQTKPTNQKNQTKPPAADSGEPGLVKRAVAKSREKLKV